MVQESLQNEEGYRDGITHEMLLYTSPSSIRYKIGPATSCFLHFDDVISTLIATYNMSCSSLVNDLALW